MATQLKLQQGGNSIEVSEKTFGREFNEALVHQVVTAYMAAGRAGTKRQKSKAEVRGGGIKPWKQKGGGRARAGSIRSPIWVGGGRAFAARPRDFSQKVNRKMYRGAIAALVGKLTVGRILHIDTQLGELEQGVVAVGIAVIELCALAGDFVVGGERGDTGGRSAPSGQRLRRHG